MAREARTPPWGLWTGLTCLVWGWRRQATDIVLRGQERVLGTGESDAQFFAKVDHFLLKYFFYDDDEGRGLSPHVHDLEAIAVLVHLERTDQRAIVGGRRQGRQVLSGRSIHDSPQLSVIFGTKRVAR